MFYAEILFFFFNDTATTEIYTLSLHDALPIWLPRRGGGAGAGGVRGRSLATVPGPVQQLRAISRATDRKSTRLNSSHANISYAVFCLKKKKNAEKQITQLVRLFNRTVR